ncbi:hypothetical protein N656DRAFT_286029 [Canariomyces notabilis]|uniref:Uncharacterized protein n=1 Tax=Canariomyces notabilis TaxID=2074819 RepID=A0AAN6QIH2_9PEZI|nr:hypothetical protein N656DRAFT_286029 [Canariomyces arenarius]
MHRQLPWVQVQPGGRHLWPAAVMRPQRLPWDLRRQLQHGALPRQFQGVCLQPRPQRLRSAPTVRFERLRGHLRRLLQHGPMSWEFPRLRLHARAVELRPTPKLRPERVRGPLRRPFQHGAVHKLLPRLRMQSRPGDLWPASVVRSQRMRRLLRCQLQRPRCRGNFRGCQCNPTPRTCGAPQSCSAGGCAGTFDPNSNVARCRNNYAGCVCVPSTGSCGTPLSCDLNGCAGTYDFNSNVARCRGNFAGCICLPTQNTCRPPQTCAAGGCEGTYDNRELGVATCKAAYRGCRVQSGAGLAGWVRHPQALRLWRLQRGGARVRRRPRHLPLRPLRGLRLCPDPGAAGRHVPHGGMHRPGRSDGSGHRLHGLPHGVLLPAAGAGRRLGVPLYLPGWSGIRGDDARQPRSPLQRRARRCAARWLRSVQWRCVLGVVLRVFLLESSLLVVWLPVLVAKTGSGVGRGGLFCYFVTPDQ